ncbi:MAG: shikimate kinase AroL [Spirochaetales bacterium]|jgi:shikimate kinase|nr:shikimate kinase AroL [Spirochaetales bacterium]
MNIFLIGYRCTGKTSVGKSLAQTLGWSFVDADKELVETYSMTINNIVSKEGWDSFREKEKGILKKICGLDKHVVATGGGVILDNKNVESMKKSGVVVWLRAEPETVKKRILQDKTTGDFRPSLSSKGLVEEIEEILLDRKPLYENAMNFSIDTDNRSIDDICGKIMGELKDAFVKS